MQEISAAVAATRFTTDLKRPSSASCVRLGDERAVRENMSNRGVHLPTAKARIAHQIPDDGVRVAVVEDRKSVV